VGAENECHSGKTSSNAANLPNRFFLSIETFPVTKSLIPLEPCTALRLRKRRRSNKRQKKEHKLLMPHRAAPAYLEVGSVSLPLN